MKLKLYAAAGLIAIAGMVSCGGNNDKEVVDKSIVPVGSDTTPVQTAITNTVNANQITAPANTPVIPDAPAANTPVTITQPQTVTMNPQANTVTTPQVVTQNVVQTTTAPGMNPPHGQPGHRCDIAAGAPLNSKPTAAPATAQPAVVNAQPQVTMKEAPTTTKTAPGMNPPHGEPGHRCDIAVGAPLNSKPAAVTTAGTPATIAPPSLLTAPKADSTKN